MAVNPMRLAVLIGVLAASALLEYLVIRAEPRRKSALAKRGYEAAVVSIGIIVALYGGWRHTSTASLLYGAWVLGGSYISLIHVTSSRAGRYG
jgi:hypothetical protein